MDGRWWKTLFAVMALALISACTTTSDRSVESANPQSIPQGAKVLVLKPDVQLSLLLATGIQEPKADWSQAAQGALSREIEAALRARSHEYIALDPATAMDGRIGQVLRLHEAVAQSILLFSYSPLRLATKRQNFDWTLGDGAQEVAAAYNADYLLFTYGRGTYSSGGRMALAVAAVILSQGQVQVGLGRQDVFTMLIDLKTGKVMWSGLTQAGPNADMRETEGANTLVSKIFEDAPL